MSSIVPETGVQIGEDERPPVDLIDYLLFVPFAISFLGVLIVFDVLQRAAYLFGQDAQQQVVRWLNTSLCLTLRVAGVKVIYENTETLPLDRPLIVISNHQSLCDIPILHHLFRLHYPRFIAKQELARGIPSVSFN